MKKIRIAILNALKKYAFLGARMPSFHGTHEAVIPECIKKKIK